MAERILRFSDDLVSDLFLGMGSSPLINILLLDVHGLLVKVELFLVGGDSVEKLLVSFSQLRIQETNFLGQHQPHSSRLILKIKAGFNRSQILDSHHLYILQPPHLIFIIYVPIVSSRGSDCSLQVGQQRRILEQQPRRRGQTATDSSVRRDGRGKHSQALVQGDEIQQSRSPPL